jgi:NAD(P)H dehydrogenase (quinone)
MEGMSAAYFVYQLITGLIDATAYFAQAAREAGLRSIVNMSQISTRPELKNHLARDLLNSLRRRSNNCLV